MKIKIDDQEAEYDVNSQLPISIDYQLEDTNEFQKKKSSEALNIKLPATLKNDTIFNTFHNPAIDDNTADETFRSIRKVTIEGNGSEILVGKSFLKKVTRQFGKPKEYEISAYGNNADWMIDLKETTLYDILKHITFVLDESTIIESWNYDGTDENLPFVMAPVKYDRYFDADLGNDNNYSIVTMRPSLSLYWTIYFAFKYVGYKIKSNFFNTDYFRRAVTPWTYGNFLNTDGTKFDIHKVLAKSETIQYMGGTYFAPWNLDVTNDIHDGGIDNNTANHPGGDYSWHLIGSPFVGDIPQFRLFEMRWTYNTPHYGPLDVGMSVNASFSADINGGNSGAAVRCHWYHTDFLTGIQTPIFDEHIFGTQGQSMSGTCSSFFLQRVNPGDWISARLILDNAPGKTGYARIYGNVNAFKVDYFRIPSGGNIYFDSLIGLKNYKVLDFLRGVIDTCNLSIQTDPINKEVVIEPTHPYSVNDDANSVIPGYFKNDFIKWTDKKDLSKESVMELFSDYERELIFKFKEDSADGAFKLVKDRNSSNMARGKYVFPNRFKAGNKEIENRFFSPTMHYEVTSFKPITGITPQMICLVPENISNTSSSESANTFLPKLAWYKGIQSGVGGWKFNGVEYETYPYMFAVNYKTGGHQDPVLSYCDEKIGVEGSYKIGRGLLKRFFWNRLAIMRNGQYLNEKLHLQNVDVTDWYHRERIDLDGNLFELYSITGFKPMESDSCSCSLRRYVPVSEKDLKATYPTIRSIIEDTLDGSTYDLKYNRLMCLASDIPTPPKD